MWRGWQKRVAAYLVLIFLVIGAIYLLQKKTVDVALTIDLDGVRTLEQVMLREMRVEMRQAGGDWSGATVHSFPESLYPGGPPLEIGPVHIGMPLGEYEVTISRVYGEVHGQEKEFTRKVLVKIQQEGPLRIRAAR
jgi:hypothetical protein